MAERPDLMPLVDLCLRRIRAGESLDACLADYPAEAAELRPLLQTALLLRAVSPPPVPDPARRAANRARFLNQAASLQAPVAVDMSTALDACLLRIHSGDSIETALADYPAQAAALRPLIETALAVRTVPAAPTPDAAKRLAYRERFLTLAAAMLGTAARVSANGHVPQTAQPAPAAPWYRRAYAALLAFLTTPGPGRRVGIAAAGLVLVLAVMGSGVLAVSAESLPGDPLYPVKEATRSVELALTFTPEARAAVLEKQDSEKQTEIVLLQERPSRPALVAIPAFSDILVSVDAEGVWTVGRVRVRVSPDMLAQIGSRVRIAGSLGPDGVVDATQVVVLASPPGAVKLAQQPTATVVSGSIALGGAAEATATAPAAAAASSATAAPSAAPTDRAGREGQSAARSGGGTATPTAPGSPSAASAPGLSPAAPPATSTPMRILAQPTASDTGAAPAAPPTGEIAPAISTPVPRVTERPTETRRGSDIRLPNVKLAKLITKDVGPNRVWLAYRSGDPAQSLYVVLDANTDVEGGALAEGRTVDIRGPEADVSLLRSTLGSLADQILPGLGTSSNAPQPDVRSGGTSQSTVLVVRARRITIVADAPPPEQDVNGIVVSRVPSDDGQSWQWTLSVGGEPLVIVQDANTDMPQDTPADPTGVPARVSYIVRNGVNVATRIRFSPRVTPTPTPAGYWFDGAWAVFRVGANSWFAGGYTIALQDTTRIILKPADSTIADTSLTGDEYTRTTIGSRVRPGLTIRVSGAHQPGNPPAIVADVVLVWGARNSVPTSAPPDATATDAPPPPTATDAPPPSPTATNPPPPTPTATDAPPPSPTATNPPPPTPTATDAPPPSPTATNPPPPTTTSPPPTATSPAQATRPAAGKPTAAATPRPGG
ncbi:MAG: DUF5667 domain-containing protein [Anaerolineae bacterium]